MTKTYCDCCGKEVSEVKKYIFPIPQSTDVKSKMGVTLCRIYPLMPKEVELCNECANEIWKVIYATREAIRMNCTIEGLNLSHELTNELIKQEF